MNDFTKDELQELIEWGDYCVGSGLCYTETEPLYGKIQSLIDNYDSLDAIRERTNRHGGCQ